MSGQPGESTVVAEALQALRAALTSSPTSAGLDDQAPFGEIPDLPAGFTPPAQACACSRKAGR